jgi:cellulose synthase/poly-beta-1,6-N-acetylglucosamine synthase-like glycosyltransferase
MIVLGVLIFFGAIYGYLIVLYTIGWFRLKKYEPGSIAGKTKVTIIVPSRNEEANILNILTDLSSQKYPHELVEIIVVDDNSTDNTAFIGEYFISQTPGKNIRVIKLTEDHLHGAFKKKAISHAIGISAGDLIVTTDADCRIGPMWLKTIVSFYETDKHRMIVSPVSFHNEQSYFERMQTLEFLSLIAITAGAIRMGKPIMCNGANLAYEKKSFFEAGGFGDDQFSSGDDVFLLLKMKKKFGNSSVGFLKNMQAMVFTEAKKTIPDFIQQRVRWASKNKGYDLKILMVSFTVYMVNLLVVGGLIYSMFDRSMLTVMTLAYLMILLIELPILIGIGNFVKRSRLLVYSFPLIVLYPLYIILTGALGIVAGYQWKGRKVKK